jgi:hypothetical protein
MAKAVKKERVRHTDPWGYGIRAVMKRSRRFTIDDILDELKIQPFKANELVYKRIGDFIKNDDTKFCATAWVNLFPE